MAKNRTQEKWTVKSPYTVTSSHRTCFTNDKFYGTEFTQRQQAIIDGEMVPNLRKLEITTIIKKAESLMLYDTADSVFQMYEYLFDESTPMPTEEEIAQAAATLDALTPDDLK